LVLVLDRKESFSLGVVHAHLTGVCGSGEDKVVSDLASSPANVTAAVGHASPAQLFQQLCYLIFLVWFPEFAVRP